MFGIADGGLTDAEIEECLESAPSDTNDRPAVEQAGRPVWPLAMIALPDPDGTLPVVSGSWTQKWTFSNAEAWTYWVYNLDTGALTSGGTLAIFAKIYGVWVR